MQNCTDTGELLYDAVADEITSWNVAADYLVYSPWFHSLLGSLTVGLTGIFPLLVIPIGEGADLKTGASATTLKILLSFAVGGLLGDVFLHLLPEAWENDLLKRATGTGNSSMPCGLWVLSGFLVFVIVEKMFAFEEPESEESAEDLKIQETPSHHQTEKEMENNNCINLIAGKNGFSKRYVKPELLKAMDEVQPFLERKQTKNGYTQLPNGYKEAQKNGFTKSMLTCSEYSNGGLRIDGANDCLKKLTETDGFTPEITSNAYGCSEKTGSTSSNQKAGAKEKSKHITGYLNLMANVIDNFTHGLAIGGSFLVSFRLGALTTFAILIHEIPHEVGDFAILLRSGFNRWDAARAQLVTASGGIFGAMFAVVFSGGGVGARTSWILPFTAGGFLHIGLVTILPELLKESSPKESLKQLGALLFGIIVMAGLTVLCD